MRGSTKDRDQSPTCDCGNPKDPDYWACDRCALLDGESPSQAEVIHAFRMAAGGPLSTTDIMTALGLTLNGAHRAVVGVERRGRVRRLESRTYSGQEPTRFLLVGVERG